MKVWNLSDYTPRGSRRLAGMKIKIKGVRIAPGESAEIPDLHPSEIAGLVRSRAVACDRLPKWYQTARRVASDAAAAAVGPISQPDDSQTEEAKAKKGKTSRRGRSS